VELDQEHAAGLELAVAARVQQAPVRIESVARCVDGLGRLVVVARVPILFGQIRQVRDDEVDRLGEGLEEVSLQHVHSILHTWSFAFRRASSTAASLVSVAQISTSGRLTASAIATAPLPVPTSATRIGTPSIRSRARSTSAPVAGRA